MTYWRSWKSETLPEPVIACSVLVHAALAIAGGVVGGAILWGNGRQQRRVRASCSGGRGPGARGDGRLGDLLLHPRSGERPMAARAGLHQLLMNEIEARR